jgi:hypothetical protein
MPKLSFKKVKFQINLHPASVGNNFFPFYAEDPLPLTLEVLLGHRYECLLQFFLSKETLNCLFKIDQEDEENSTRL